jgi:hypothetical protein
MGSPKPLPPPPTEPGEFVLSKDGKDWELETAAAEPVCTAAPPAEPAPAQLSPGDL